MIEPLLFKVGDPCPVPVGKQEGSRLEVDGTGLILVMNYPNLTDMERAAWDNKVRQYSVYTTRILEVALIFTIFKFASPMGYVETNLDATLVPADAWKSFREPVGGDVKNTVMVLLVDREMIQGVRLLGMSPEMIHMIIRTGDLQRRQGYTRAGYDRALSAAYAKYSTKQMYKRGTIFNHRLHS